MRKNIFQKIQFLFLFENLIMKYNLALVAIYSSDLLSPY